MVWSDDGANLIGVVDAAGGAISMTYDALNNLVAITDALTHTTTYAYSGTLLISSTDALSNSTYYTYTTGAGGIPAGLLAEVYAAGVRTVTNTTCTGSSSP
jgi:YD repeat-containing protein